MTTTFDTNLNHNNNNKNNNNNNNNNTNNTNPFANELNSTTGTGHTLSTLETETTRPGYPSDTFYEDHSGRFNDTKNAVAEPTSNSLLTTQDGITHRENSQFDYLTNAGETARKYLPTRVVEVLGVTVPGNGIENTTNNNNSTLPGQENSFQPTRGGVGSLPGNPSEANVAKLPEERALEAQVGKELGRDGVMGTVADPHNVDSIPTNMDNSSPLAFESAGTGAQFSDPITEPFPKSGDGVALQHLARPDVQSTEHTRPLPTFISATLTPEAERDQELHNDTSVDTNKPLPSGGVSTPQTTQQPHATTPHVSTPQTTTPHTSTSHTSTPHTTTQDKSTNTPKGDDASGSYSAAQAARQAPNTTPGKSHNEEPYPKTAHDMQGGNHSDRKSSVDTNSTANSENKQNNGKPSMGQKIKGEVKVLAGKLSNDQAKIESGQAMKKGTTA